MFTAPQVGHVGLTEREVRALGKPYYLGRYRYHMIAAGMAMAFEAEDGDNGLVKLLLDEDLKILGVHIVGFQAAALVQPFVYPDERGPGPWRGGGHAEAPDALHGDPPHPQRAGRLVHRGDRLGAAHQALTSFGRGPPGYTKAEQKRKDVSDMIAVGAKAPDFTLEDQHGNKVSLSDFKGRKVLLSWHPLAWTSVCTDQMRALEPTGTSWPP